MKGAVEVSCYYPYYLGFPFAASASFKVGSSQPPGRATVPKSKFYSEWESVFHWTDSSLGSFGRRLPGERDIILGTWLPCLISFQKD